MRTLFDLKIPRHARVAAVLAALVMIVLAAFAAPAVHAAPDCGLSLELVSFNENRREAVVRYSVPANHVARLTAEDAEDEEVNVTGNGTTAFTWKANKAHGAKVIKLADRVDEVTCVCRLTVTFPPRPTATPTNTPVTVTATPTNTPVTVTATPTNTPVTVTATPNSVCLDNFSTAEVEVLYQDGVGNWLPLERQRLKVVVDGMGEYYAETDSAGVAIVQLPLPQNAYGASTLEWVADLRDPASHPANGWTWTAQWGQIHGLRACGRAFGTIKLTEGTAPTTTVPPFIPPVLTPPATPPADDCPVVAPTECEPCELLRDLNAKADIIIAMLGGQNEQIDRIESDTQATVTWIEAVNRILQTVDWSIFDDFVRFAVWLMGNTPGAPAPQNP